MNNEYIIVDKTKILQRIEELESKIIPNPDNDSSIDSYNLLYIAKQNALYEFLSNSIYSQVNREQEGYFSTPEQLNEFIANVIKQTLETAAEKANLISLGAEQEVWNSVSTDIKDFVVNKQSITNTFEETFKKFEVI